MIHIRREHILDGYDFDELYCILNTVEQANSDIKIDNKSIVGLLDDEMKLVGFFDKCRTDLCFTEAELAFYFLVEKGIYKSDDLIKELSEMKIAVSKYKEDSSESNKAIRDTVQLCYVISGSNGTVSREAENILRSRAAYNLVNYAADKKFWAHINSGLDFLKYVWDLVIRLIDKGVLVKFYPIEKTNNFFYMPERNICFQMPNAIEKQNDFIVKLFTKYPDLSFKYKGGIHRWHEKYEGKAFPFSMNRFTSAGISITTDCQYRCEYCSFESGEHKSYTLDMDSIRAFVDYLIKNAILKRMVTQCKPTVKIIIAGGGEPTIYWSIFTQCVDYILKKSRENDVLCHLSITTNGCLSPKQTEYIMKNFNSVNISFDGMPKLQNQNRHFADGSPTFEVVNQTLKMLDSAYFNYSIISVVQPNDFTKIRDIAQFVFLNYPNVRNLSIRPSMSVGRAAKNRINSDIMTYDFAVNYFNAMKFLGYPLNMSCGLFHERNIGVFCGASYGNHPWLIPNGSIVACQDGRESAIIIGGVESGVVNMRVVRDLYADVSFANDKKCKICILYNKCKGGCPLTKNSIEAQTFQRWSCREAKKYLGLKLQQLLNTGYYGLFYLQREQLKEYPDSMIFLIKER